MLEQTLHYEQYAVSPGNLSVKQKPVHYALNAAMKCTGCEASDIRMNGWSVSETWPRMISYMNLLSPEKTMRGIQLTFYLIHVYVRIDHLLHELFCEITEVEELRFILVARNWKSEVHADAWQWLFVLVGGTLDFSN